MRRFIPAFVMMLAAVIAGGCGRRDADTPPKPEPTAAAPADSPVARRAMGLTSAGLKDIRFPVKYTCDGENVSPPLEIADVPKGTKSLALVMDDPDAPRGTFVHWVVWNIPPDTRSIPEGEEPPGAAGKNSAGKIGYFGPCPPKGADAHRYQIHLYALRAELDLAPGSTRDRLQQAMQEHVVAETVLIRQYSRPE